MKRAIIIHGWGGSPNEILMKFLKKGLEKKGFEVIAPQMPNSDEPKIGEWVSFLEQNINEIDENTYFIGHSIGCQTIMRYLEKQTKKVGMCIFIAGWFNLDNMESKEEERIARPWIETSINFDKIRRSCQNIKVFLSSNEFYGFVKENKKIFEKDLGAKVQIVQEMGHFTDEEGDEKLSNFVNAVMKNI